MSATPDLFSQDNQAKSKRGQTMTGRRKVKSAEASYTAKDIEVLEGLEPVRRRPGMYIGGTDERALHHLVAEALDNAMDEVVSGHASWIELDLAADATVTVRDNGRGIPVDPHPKFKTKSALEVILTTLHAGGKFGGKAYGASGGLHGVGISVVNALSDVFEVEVARDRVLWKQAYSRGKAKGKLKQAGTVSNRRGTTVRFHPDPEIFGPKVAFRPSRMYRMARSKAYLSGGVEIRWSCDPSLVPEGSETPQAETICFPGGIRDFLTEAIGKRPTYMVDPFAGAVSLNGEGRLEWAIAWPGDEDGFINSYVNAVPTPQGGSHEQGLRAALTKGLRSYGELTGNKKANLVSGDDVMEGAAIVLSLFVRDPEFQGQTKERLGMPAAARIVENTLKDHFDHYLSADPEPARRLLERLIDKAEERKRRKAQKELDRKSATRKLRLPGKLADCSRQSAEGTEIFLVEGDSAGGSAKQARMREIQAILPLRGKILNVASASAEKQSQNQELRDLVQALGCGTGANYDESRLRYERVIIMTDADVDGAHIASLLLTFFYKDLLELIAGGHLYLAMPPLYRLAKGGEVIYARDDAHKDEILKKQFKGGGKVETSRFKGLGEMPSAQLKSTTMDPAKRTLLRVVIPSDADETAAGNKKGHTARIVEALMGRKPELRLAFIQERARFVDELDV
jgi:topoisomerase-4 subunit B